MSAAPSPPQERRWWMRVLARAQHSKLYPVIVSLLAIVSAGTGLYPFGPVLAAAVIFAPQRWRQIYLASCLGATLGALVLAGMAAHYGLPWAESMFPGIEQRADWLKYTYWMSRYGWIALLIFAALPVPQMPALLLSAISQVSLPQIAVAIFIGKLIKYGIYGGAVLAALRAIQERK